MAPALVGHIRWRFVSVLLLVPVLLLATSCALIARGTSQGIPFNSNPPGAEVYLDGELVGITPTTVELSRSGSHTLLVRLGGQEREVILTNSVDSAGGVGLTLDIVPGVPAVVVTTLAVADAIDCRGGCTSWGCDLCALNLWPLFITVPILLGSTASLMVDLSTGAIYDLSPGEVFIDFEVQEEATNN